MTDTDDFLKGAFKMRKSKAFTFSLAVSLIVAAIMLIYIIVCLAKSYIFPTYRVLFLAVSFAVLLLVALSKRIPNAGKVTASTVIFLIILPVFAFSVLFGATVEFRAFDGAEEIGEYYRDFDFEKYGDFEEISNYKYYSMAIFQEEAYTTFLKYDEENFSKEKNSIENGFVFYEAPAEKGEGEPTFSHEGFDFRTEVNEEWYPKELHLVGIKEETREIVHVYFEDYDLDTVTDFGEFLDFYCGWRYVMKERS